MTVKFKHLVLDSGPIIQNSFSPTLSEHFYTVPEVISEIKDQATRERLSTLPFQLCIRNPSVEALKAVREFAKGTGDSASLSATDLKVIALTLTLEREENGDGRIRLVPEDAKVHKGAQTKIHETPKTIEASEVSNRADTVAKELTEKPASTEGWDGEWITPDNISTIRAKSNTATISFIETGLVGCISTDFAIQNVLLQMKLKLYSPAGYRIRQVKNWLLRCHACYKTTKQLDRRFCEHCGGATLIRTSFMVDEQGQMHLFLKKDFQYNLRGTKAPLPNPKSGRDGNNILLREDQKEYQQAVKKYQRQEKKAAKVEDLDAIDDRLATVFGGMSFKGAKNLDLPTLPTIGFGRRNPNQSRRRV